jgi:putative flippase GtrA
LVQSLLSIDLLHHGYFLALAIAIGALAGMGVNFVLSRRFVFAPDQRPARDQFFSFLVISLTTLGLRLVVAYALMALLALPLLSFVGALPVPGAAERLAHLGAVGLVTIYSFLAHKHISFGGGFLNRLGGRNTVVS